MLKSTGMRYLLVGVVTLFMFIPMFFVSDVVNSRQDYSAQTTRDLGREWGGEQILNGPFIRIPVTQIIRVQQEKSISGDGVAAPVEKITYIDKIVSADPLFILPETLTSNIETKTEFRKRGIFEVPVYRADATQEARFEIDDLQRYIDDNETIIWNEAQLVLGITNNSSLRDVADLQLNGVSVKFEPRPISMITKSLSMGGIYAEIGDPRKISDVKISLKFLGSDSLFTTPIARNNTVTFTSDWPHPSFTGEFLPDTREITVDGFSATWKIPHLARPVSQVSRESQEKILITNTKFGFKFFQPNNFYKKAYRASRYAILFIALTFLTILLLDQKNKIPAHPVQYLMIGITQIIFVLLMVSFAEHIGFSWAYILASVATVSLLTFYAYIGLKMGKRTWIVGAVLLMLYAVLYFILNSIDYALLAGSLLAFGAISAAMLATRNEDWYGKPKEAPLRVKKKTKGPW